MWVVSVTKPRKNDGQYLYLRARVKHQGKWIENRVSANTTDQKAAEELARSWQRDLNSLPSDGEFKTFEQVLEARIRDMESSRKSKKNTIAGFKNAKKALCAIIGDVLIEDFGKAHIKKARRELLEHLAPITVKTYESNAAASWRWAVEEELIDKPWPELKKVKARPSGKKRPYTDKEVGEVLEWISGYRGGRYLPAVSFLADTGRRVSEILAVKGADINRQASTVTIKQRKAGKQLNVSIPVPPSTMKLLPSIPVDGFAFANHGRYGNAAKPDHSIPIRRETILTVIKKAVKALGIPDGDRLDTHSFRRAFVASAERSGVPGDVGRRITGHETQAMWEHYQSQAVGDNLHQAVNAIHDKRASLSPRPSQRPSQSSHDFEKLSELEVSKIKACDRERSGGLIFTNSILIERLDPNKSKGSAKNRWEGRRDLGEQTGDQPIGIWGRDDPQVVAISKWASEDPGAMKRLLDDPVLQKFVREALLAFGLIGSDPRQKEA
ncbi:MAG: site-specific integrase [Planctomycetota bacterium]|nr:site-specific integrase [Planctomycetota bacterium]